MKAIMIFLVLLDACILFAAQPNFSPNDEYHFEECVYTKLAYNTVKIEIPEEAGPVPHRQGTGFIINWVGRKENLVDQGVFPKGESDIPYHEALKLQLDPGLYLVTCKHCIIHSDPSKEDWYINLRFIFANTEDTETSLSKARVDYKLEAGDLMFHSTDQSILLPTTTDVDIAFVKLDQILKLPKYNTKSRRIIYHAIPFTYESEANCNQRNYYAKVLMYGYPNGYSTSDFFPIVRTGHCASDPRKIDLKAYGFRTDMSSMVGSSGSPVFFDPNDKILVSSGDKFVRAKSDVQRENGTNILAGMFWASMADDSESYTHLGSVINIKTIFDLLSDKSKLVELSSLTSADVGKLRKKLYPSVLGATL